MGDESDGSHEGHACNEEEGSEQDCEGQTCKVGGLPWYQGQDLLWIVQERLDQEQEWQDCEQEAVCQRQEGLRQHQGLDCCCPEGKALGVKGFVAVKKGTPLYKKAKELFQWYLQASQGHSSGCGDVYALRAP